MYWDGGTYWGDATYWFVPASPPPNGGSGASSEGLVATGITAVDDGNTVTGQGITSIG